MKRIFVALFAVTLATPALAGGELNSTCPASFEAAYFNMTQLSRGTDKCDVPTSPTLNVNLFGFTLTADKCAKLGEAVAYFDAAMESQGRDAVCKIIEGEVRELEAALREQLSKRQGVDHE
jgi:hypothetical protein